MYYYCSAPGCGNRIEYQVTKPTSCPKCKTVFADLGKTLAKAKPLPEIITKTPSKHKEIDEEENLENEETEESQSLTRQISESKKAILKRARARKLAERGEVDEEDEEIDDDSGDDYNEESVSKSKIKRLAQELAASIDPSSIKIIGGDEDDGPSKITFRKWCAEKD